MQFSLSKVVGEIFYSWDENTQSTTGTSPPGFPESATKIWYGKLFDMNIEKCLQKCLYATDWLVWKTLSE